jgi:hypothetical protein
MRDGVIRLVLNLQMKWNAIDLVLVGYIPGDTGADISSGEADTSFKNPLQNNLSVQYS